MPPRGPLSFTFPEEFSPPLIVTLTRTFPVLILGNFHIHLDDPRNTLISQFFNFLSSKCLVLHTYLRHLFLHLPLLVIDVPLWLPSQAPSTLKVSSYQLIPWNTPIWIHLWHHVVTHESLLVLPIWYPPFLHFPIYVLPSFSIISHLPIPLVHLTLYLIALAWKILTLSPS